MARQKLPPPPPATSQSDTSDDDSSSDEEQVVTRRIPSDPKTPKPTERHDDESDSDSDSDSDPEPPTKTLNTPQKPSDSESESDPEPPTETLNTPQKPSQKPSESEDDSSEDEEDEEDPKLPAAKKVKLSSAPSQPPWKKSSSVGQRIWTPEDEKTLIRALSDYLARNGEFPPKKEYPSFLSTISSSIQFPVTDGQMFNKIRHMRRSCKDKKGKKGKKGSDASSSNPDGSSLFQMWTELFASEKDKGSSKASMKWGSLKIGGTANGSMAKGVMGNGVASCGGRVHGGKAGDGAGNGGGANGGDVAGSNFYLGGLIKDMISRQHCPGWFPTVEDVVVRIGESKACELEAKAKMLRIDAMKLLAREETLNAELFKTFADVMADN